MNAPAATRPISLLTAAIGARVDGGWIAGHINAGPTSYAIILPPKAERIVDSPMPWSDSMQRVSGAESYWDGLANTQAMATAGSKIAVDALARGLYIPARDELECLYRAFKPTVADNWTGGRSGDNPSSTPPGYPYSKKNPGKTQIEAFQARGAEALEPIWYWSSTQDAFGGACAWLQNFEDGSQDLNRKSNSYGVVLVRREIIR